MKRSQAVELIMDVVNDVLHPLYRTISLEDAERVLAALERVGMKPPVTVKDPVLLRQEFVWEPENTR